ncbi:hypothetical protein AAL_07632 [Moelleriella libera RCEF 2490]|uniref:Uncharacterized protein n=1 Tax=Moelleriella libera RCEF 2490 TaxID=1081109 RepID=A0A167X7W3_9HYPO|nr:hypothetical protein AAL_07632 [Moelleriella libera RCEF 2490]
MTSLLPQLADLPPEQQEQILNGPAMAPPPGIVPNYDDPPNHNAIGYGVGAVCLVLACLVFVIRIHCRRRILKVWKMEDCAFSSKELKSYFVSNLAHHFT